MEFLSHYLSRITNKKIIYFVGNNKDAFDGLKSTLNESRFDDLTVVFEDPQSKIEVDSSIKVLNKREIAEDYSDSVFVFDYYNNLNEMYAFVKNKPSEVVAYISKKTKSIEIWKKYRTVSKRIVVARFVNEYRNEVLDWEKNDKPELSVVLPVYNVSKYLDKCLETLTVNKEDYIEYLFVDDGSPDNSAEIIKNWQKKDPRIKLISKENGGCASARQVGLEHAQGRYVGFIDPDDFIDPTMLEKLLYRALVGTYDISYSGYYEFYEETNSYKSIDDLVGFPFSEGTSDRNLIDQLLAYRRIAIWRGIYRREFLLENSIGFHIDIKRFDDLPFKVETFAKAKSVASVNENLYFYRLGREGQDVSCTDSRLYVHFDIFKHLDAFFENCSSQQKEYYRIVKAQTHLWALSVIDPKFEVEYKEKAAKDLGVANNEKEWKKLEKQYGPKPVKEDEAKILLSIVLPFYNNFNFLNGVINRLPKEFKNDVEVIFVNDGSTIEPDASFLEIIGSNKNYKLLNVPHGGVSKARNIGLGKAVGKYVWFVDSDDELDEASIKKLLDIVRASSFDVCVSDFVTIDGKSKKYHEVYGYNSNALFTNYFVSSKDDPYVWNKIYKTELLKKNKIFFDENLEVGEDVLFNFEVFKNKVEIIVCKDPVYQYHIDNTKSIMATSTTDKKIYNHFIIVEKLIKILNEMYVLDEFEDAKDYFKLLVTNSFDENQKTTNIQKLEKMYQPNKETL